MVLRCGYEIGTVELQSIMGWPTVSECVRQQSFALITKINQSNKPVSVRNRLTLVRDSHLVNTRSRCKNHYVLPKIKTIMGSRSFIFRVVKIWNSLQK